jgi:hypothetical protein
VSSDSKAAKNALRIAHLYRMDPGDLTGIMYAGHGLGPDDMGAYDGIADVVVQYTQECDSGESPSLTWPISLFG